MRLVIVALMAGALSGCVGTSRYVALPGYTYKTDRTCKRSKPPSQFDERCDCPRVGVKDAIWPLACDGP